MQPIHNSSSKKDIYDRLRKSHLAILEASDIWNWDTLSCLTRPSLERILHLNYIYKLSLNIPGDIFEFGCRYGASTAILNNLKRIYEPNSIRQIHTFDSFEGFKSIDKVKDKSSTEFHNKAGDYNLNLKDFDNILMDILSEQESLDSNISSTRSFTINKGFIEETLPDFLKKNSSIICSLVIFDMDLYKPTLVGLELIKPHLINGSLIIFDEILNYKQYPGESLALRKCSYSDNLIPLEDSNDLIKGAAMFRYIK